MNNIANDITILALANQLELNVLRSLPIQVKSIEKHSHGPCKSLVHTCGYCMLHGNVFITNSYDTNKIIHSHLLQDNKSLHNTF